MDHFMAPTERSFIIHTPLHVFMTMFKEIIIIFLFYFLVRNFFNTLCPAVLPTPLRFIALYVGFQKTFVQRTSP